MQEIIQNTGDHNEKKHKSLKIISQNHNQGLKN